MSNLRLRLESEAACCQLITYGACDSTLLGYCAEKLNFCARTLINMLDRRLSDIEEVIEVEDTPSDLSS